MATTDYNLQVKISELNELVRQLRIRTAQLVNLTLDPDENFVYITMAFLNRMMSHADSVQRLEGRRDALLIGRSALEGYAVYFWISQSVRLRNSRALKYRQIGHINMLIRYEKVIEALKGHSKRAEREKLKRKHRAYSKWIATYCKPVLRQSDLRRLEGGFPRKSRNKRDPLYQDYIKRLVGSKATLRTLIANAERRTGKIREEAYRRAYNDFSQFHHWEPIGLPTTWDEQSERVVYGAEDPLTYSHALAAVYVCLSEMTKLAANSLRKEHLAQQILQLDARFETLYA